ncbi:hypothetical protein F5B22DRAFT_582138 [Xylaria bambusicola]|uniref:uncharacterized protein n=1 Tax=Xylaria bambusicola TaxID=326684 RepID=UPI002008E83E|nr:uncharacterized protein F5B22DRAFT_582138 [Xylaria bambusicola]KAI0527740.1 hypothetical protein F5B22DRAFT_582138 [Xylaria bambusicola]
MPFDQDVMDVLKSHFPIESYLFAAQSSRTFQRSGLSRKLVSMQNPTEQYTLTYLEVDLFEGTSKCAICLQRFAAAEWNIALDYLGKRVLEIQINMWEYEEDRSQQDLVDHLKETIQLATEWCRNVPCFIEGVEWSLETLGVCGQSQIQPDQDYGLVLLRLQGLKTGLDSIATGVISIQGTIQGQVSFEVVERSRKEAALSRQLLWIALIFIPLTYSTSLFGMEGDFLPGSRLLGIYFAVAIPLTLLAFLVFCLLALHVVTENFIFIFTFWIIFF